jgi:hypothetical protein
MTALEVIVWVAGSSVGGMMLGCLLLAAVALPRFGR